MDRTNSKRKRELYSVLLMIVLIGITIGYAALSTNLNINGTSKVSSNTWDIHFANIVVNPESVEIISPDQAATITANDTTEVTYAVTLSKPGDFYEFTVEAVNAGTVDGMIGSITSKLNGTVIDSEHPLPVYLDYSLTYDDGTPIAENHLLEAGHREAYKVRLEFKKDIANGELPATDITPSFTFGVGYIQKSSSAIRVPHSVIYTANVEPNMVSIGSPIPNNITQYNTITEARTILYSYYSQIINIDGFSYALRHTVNNNIVTESYIGFESYNGSNEHYYLRGGVDESALTEKPVYEENKRIIQSVYGERDCQENVALGKYHCNHALQFDVYTNGYISIINNKSLTCIVTETGSSYCKQEVA